MKKILAVFFSLALLLGTFSGCEKDPGPYEPTGGGLSDNAATEKPVTQEQQIQTLSLVYDPSDPINPYQCTGYTNRVLFSLMYQGLFTVDADYQVYPVLCDTFNISADMKTYTFHLADALFSDGTRIGANDVVQSLTAAMGSPWYGGRLQHVQSVTAYGEAVVVELRTPMENLPLLLDIPIVKASEVAISNPTGSGPYRMTVSAQGAQLHRQAAWWCTAQLPVYGEVIALRKAETMAQLQDAFKLDKVSMVCTDAEKYVDMRSDYELWDCENGLFLYLVCNEKSLLLQDPAVRRALTHAIDREMLAETYYHGFAMPAQLPVSPDSPWYTQQLAQNYGYAPEKFSAAVAASQEPSREIVLLLNGDDICRLRVGQAIEKMLEACGLQVSILKSSTEKLEENLRYGTYDLYLGQTRLSGNMDLSAFFGTNTSLNFGGLSDPAIYAMSLEALANAGNYYKLHELVMEEGQLCPILFQNNAIYTQRGAFTGLQPARDATFFYTVGRTMEDAWLGRD